MAAPHDQPDGVENDVVGENRAHIVGMRAGATHQRLDIEDDALTDGTLEIIGADRGGNDEVAHEHAVEFAFLIAPANEAARQQSPIDFRRSVGIGLSRGIRSRMRTTAVGSIAPRRSRA